tara:strand:+ start:4061 stop:5221 length:1161 start_codon:yes stop_codon:yes gene_type:complete
MPQQKKKKRVKHIGLYEASASTTSASSIGVEDKFREEHYISTLMTLPYDEIKGTKAEGDWHDIQGVLHGSVSKIPEDKRNIIQKTADKIYESGPIGSMAAGVADILPGIPFVDIIDPPSELSDPQMQTSRNLLGALSFPMMMKQAPKAIGRVATNIREPFGYSGSLKKMNKNIIRGEKVDRSKMSIADGGLRITGATESASSNILKDSGWVEPRKVKRIANAISRGIKSIVQDKPLYSVIGGSGERHKAVSDAREFLYRRTFGLKPRRGTKIFKENKDGTLSFNPKSKRGQLLIDEIKMGVNSPFGHGVMGGYSSKLKGGKIHYEDIWDFKMNPGEWKEVFHTNTHLKGWKSLYPYGREDLAKQAGLRTLVDLITTSPVIKGSVAY